MTDQEKVLSVYPDATLDGARFMGDPAYIYVGRPRKRLSHGFTPAEAWRAAAARTRIADGEYVRVGDTDFQVKEFLEDKNVYVLSNATGDHHLTSATVERELHTRNARRVARV